MIAFDTDILGDILQGKPAYVARASVIPADQQTVPVVVAEESLRGWLNLVRQADAGKVKTTLEHAYARLVKCIRFLGAVNLLPYTPDAHQKYAELRSLKLRIGTQDLRIAAICIAHDVTLVSRNKRDYELVPGLKLEVWN